jgi:3-methyl-2-oxobutanoate hydroxymethyltransferase
VSTTVPAIRSAKVRDGHAPLVMVTAYDTPSARVADAAEVDMVLVGDSLAMVVLGYEDTLQITVADMAHHVGAVARAKPQPLIVADLPWLSFHVSVQDTVRNAATLVRAGAEAVKLEGGTKRLPMVAAIIDAEIPVMGHLGLTPQSTHVMGGFKVQGRKADAAKLLVEEALALQAAGCFAIVLEGVPDVVGSAITDALDVPTIGIGAGPGTDGQVLVYHDLIGLENRFKPRFVRRYGSAFDDQVSAVKAYAGDVRSQAFPSKDETYAASEELSDAFGLYGRGVS